MKQKAISGHRSPEECFGFAQPFCDKPRYMMLPTFRPVRGEATVPRSVFRPTPLSMVKSASMPACLPTGYSDDPTVESPPVMERNVWQCRCCGTRDASRLERNPADGSLSCDCGADAGMLDMVSMERSKNCHKDDDPTQVADAPPSSSAAQAAPWNNGPMSREDRRRHENAQMGGTHVSNACARKNAMQQALSAVERQARKDAADIIRPDGPDNGRGQKLMDGLSIAFDRLTVFPEKSPVKEHIRTEAIRIYRNSCRHDQHCGTNGCIFSLQNKNMAVLVVGLIELVLSQLAGDEPGDGRTVEEISQGNVSPMDIRRGLEQLHQYQEECKISYGHRLEVLSSVTRICAWYEPGKEQFKCEPAGCHAGGCFTTAARISCPDEFGKTALPDPSDNSGKLHMLVTSIIRANPMDTETKAAVGYQTRQPELLEYLCKDHGLPREVLAFAVVVATAKKMQKQDVLHELRRVLFRRMNISSSTVDAFIEQLMPRIELPPPMHAAPEPGDKPIY